MSRLQKFSPLSLEKISRIVDNLDPALDVYTRVAVELLAENSAYQKLVEDYEAAQKSGTALEFINENQAAIQAFLNDCALIGYVDEKSEPEKSYTIGADGVSIIATYLASKEINVGAHQVQVIKNQPLQTPKGTRKQGKIFLERDQVHEALYRQLRQDLATEGELNKTYLVETFGTVGGNHVVALTVRKKAGELEPVFDLFDPSPALVRNGLEAAQNSIAIGWCSQLMINATAKKACADKNLVLRSENFFANSEPLQRAGLSNCATFAYEAAFMYARMSREEHERFLRETYRDRNPYGGKTEFVVEFDERGYAKISQLALPLENAVMSNFTDTALRPRSEELAQLTHKTKSGEESALQRVARYQSADGFNQLVEQKVLRQKVGHIFEIVTSPQFRAHAAKVSDAELQAHRAKLLTCSPYFPKDVDEAEPTAQTQRLVKAFNGILPNFNRVTDAKCEGDVCEVRIHLGILTAKKLEKLMRELKVEMEIKTVDFSHNLVETDPELAKLNIAVIKLPQEKQEDLAKILEEKKREFDEELKKRSEAEGRKIVGKLLYTAEMHAFMPQQKTAPLTAAPVARSEVKAIS